MEHADFLILGGGIAGISLGAELSKQGRTLILEREQSPAMHSSGRSATFFNIALGNSAIHKLTRASQAYLEHPPAAFEEYELFRSWRALMVAREQQLNLLRDKYASLCSLSDTVRWIEEDEILQQVPVLKTGKGHVVAGILDDAAGFIDGNGLLQGYLRELRSNNGQLLTNAEAQSITHHHGNWRVSCQSGTYAAPVLVNAAGAWVDHIASLASIDPIGLQPKRRTMIVISPPEDSNWRQFPLVRSVEEEFVLLPDASGLLASPADETDVQPSDVQPEEFDIALAAHRIEEVTTMKVERITHKWAGLRNFVRDRNPVIGFDSKAKGFFWLAGQGGYGLQTSPAVSQLAAAMISQNSVPDFLDQVNLDPAELSPCRLRVAD